MLNYLCAFLLCFFCLINLHAQEYHTEFSSPEKHLKVVFNIIEGKIGYAVEYDGKNIVDEGSLGFIVNEKDSLLDFESVNTKRIDHHGIWQTVWGQTSTIKDNYTELRVALISKKSKRLLNIKLRAYDDGFAFQYEIPTQKALPKLTVTSEESRFTLNGNYACWWSWADYNTLEKNYYHTSIDSATHVATPFTLQREDGIYMSIHEAAIIDYSTMTLRQDTSNTHRYKINLVPWADGSLVKTNGHLISPWRVFILGHSPAALIESTLILNLNAPNKLKDVSWIQPMTYAGIWWEMHLGLSTWKQGPTHGATTINAKRYIDFASANGIKGILMEGWNTGWENWGKKDAFDFVTACPDLDLKEVVRYARTKGVEMIGHHETGGDTESYEKHLTQAFKMYRELGIRIVKTGYAGSVTPAGEYHHGQCMVRHYNKVMRMAAKYHIMLDVHEPIILSGLSRTYPNLMTAEGVRGMEWNAWSQGNMPSHTCTLPFTRGIAGPMDYTAGIFDIDLSKHAKERVKWNGPDSGSTAVHSTLANQLALMIVLYSPLQMAADLPENYSNHPAFNCIKSLPTTWDESHVLDAKIGEYIIMARRSGTTWYIAGITNELGRECNVSLDFLKHQWPFNGTLYADGRDAHYELNPESYTIQQLSVSSDIFNIKLAPGGGFVLKLEK